MNVKVEKKEHNIIELEITVEAEKFNEGIKSAYKKNVKKFNIPGFRQGKAPMHIIKKFYGEGVFFEDAINFCCDETYPVALKENNIKPVDYPQIDVVEIGEGKDLVYKAIVAVYPEVELGQYKGVEVEKVTYEVSEADLENAVKAEQTKNARTEDKKDGAIENGDIAVIDFKGFIDDVAFDGGEGTDYELEIGSKTFIDNFEEQLVGLKVGEKKDVNVKFPEEYGRDELNGKAAKFEVEIKAIKVKQLPELNDEFAKEVSEFDTFEAYKNSLKENMEKANEERAKREFEEKVLDKVADNTTIDIPNAMVEKEIDYMVKDLEMRLKYQGLDLDLYCQYTNSTMESMRNSMREMAEKRVKNDLVISKIAEVENITATPEEIKAKATELAKQYGQEDIDKAADMIVASQGAYIQTSIVNEKVIDMLVKEAK
ncbi:trigger factor [Hathewaya proteolytica DSM 3090]|uniref:Trigger factor n=1 Tax=Hathewaya proteolytica DSM 3090 TaxID=1121331 RepID=A0A1M6Q790_9CLOT|nr:trigger factor [Hathewaya proteolytica]SHK16010.1 trigger factor [Hathewaya proteolytica DSM 3090]